MSDEAKREHVSGGEAGGTAFCDFYHPIDGYRIGVSARDVDATSALNQLIECIKGAKEVGLVMLPPRAEKRERQSGSTPTPSDVGAPVPASGNAPAPVSSASNEQIEVIAMTTGVVELTKGGDKVMKMKGGPVMKFGVPCYPEVLSTIWNVDVLEVGKEYNLTGYTAHVLKEGSSFKKVVGISSVDDAA